MIKVIEMKSVISSNISAIGYDEEAKELHVSFNKSGTYIYSNVEPKIFESFISADSKGKFFLANIKPVFTNYRKAIKETK
jgi:hypothetical protein